MRILTGVVLTVLGLAVAVFGIVHGWPGTLPTLLVTLLPGVVILTDRRPAELRR